jgi:hypothetical protein
MTKKIKQQAQRLHTHRILFTATDDQECAARALLGQSTLAIATATRLTPGQVQYRITKAGINRWDFRNGKTPLANRMIDLGYNLAAQQVTTDIAPKFAKFASK